MRHARWTTSGSRLTTLGCRSCGHSRLLGLFGLVLLMGVGVAATTSPPVPAVMRAGRIEVVSDEGNVVFVARATDRGGRIEVVNVAGEVIFSAGAHQDDQEQRGLWEQTLRKIGGQRHDLESQRQTLKAVTRQLQEVERLRQRLQHMHQLQHEINRQGRELAQRQRALDTLERELRQLRRQVHTLERR